MDIGKVIDAGQGRRTERLYKTPQLIRVGKIGMAEEFDGGLATALFNYSDQGGIYPVEGGPRHESNEEMLGLGYVATPEAGFIAVVTHGA
jgi:hypothetical protein